MSVVQGSFRANSMRNHVTFVHPAPFVPLSEEDGILAVGGAAWFADLLRRVPALQVESELCQEDWGVVVFAHRSGFEFWIGLAQWFDAENGWLAHVHHRGLLQRLRPAGRQAIARLVEDVHTVLSAERDVSGIRWYEDGALDRAEASSAASPLE